MSREYRLVLHAPDDGIIIEVVISASSTMYGVGRTVMEAVYDYEAMEEEQEDASHE